MVPKYLVPLLLSVFLTRQAGGLVVHPDTKLSPLFAALRLASDSPCAPRADRVVELLHGRSQRDAQTPELKFYMYDDGAFNFTETMDCFFTQTHGTLGVDEMDSHVPPQTAQHMTDYWLLELMRSHPSRTEDPEEADLFVVGAPLMSSWFAARQQGPCDHVRRARHHTARVDGVYDALRESKYWARKGGRDHFFINTATWGHLEHSTHGELYRMMFGTGGEGNVIYATADRKYRGLGLYKSAMAVPYKSHYLLDKPGQPRQHVGREVAITFHGDMGRGSGFRSYLPGLADGLPDASIRDVRLTHGDVPMDELRVAVEDTAMTYLNSTFCFVPAGATPTSRRLFDALAAGCIPVVLATFDSFADSLPFKKTVDWAQVAIFAGDFNCTVANQGGMAAWLKGLVAKRGDESVVEVQRRGIEAFRHLSYHSPDMVDAILREAQPYLYALE